ncbi:transposase IS116/IS110/IS902 family protein [Pandoraea sp. SD6-2]|nr:transposase IS116/IS110/IS902 family protein [Pandoraea sp. SD6-2]
MTPSMSSLASTSATAITNHAVALDRNGTRLYNKPLPNDEAQLRTLITEFKARDQHLPVIAFAACSCRFIPRLSECPGLAWITQHDSSYTPRRQH